MIKIVRQVGYLPELYEDARSEKLNFACSSSSTIYTDLKSCLKHARNVPPRQNQRTGVNHNLQRTVLWVSYPTVYADNGSTKCVRACVYVHMYGMYVHPTALFCQLQVFLHHYGSETS